MADELVDAIVNMQETTALKIANERLGAGEDPVAVLNSCRSAMRIIGRRFETGEAFIPELILGGEILRQISDLVKPKLAQEVVHEKRAKIVFGTVQGDIHDIGKDIVVFMLDINGFEVIDLGVDVPPERFVDVVVEEQATILGLSGFLTLVFEPMKVTVEALRTAGIRDQVKVMIGGGPITEQVKDYTGADGWGSNATEAVRLAQYWTDAQEG